MACSISPSCLQLWHRASIIAPRAASARAFWPFAMPAYGMLGTYIPAGEERMHTRGNACSFIGASAAHDAAQRRGGAA